MKRVLACLVIAALPALAQQQNPVARPPAPAKAPSMCGECGVVTSIRRIEKQEPTPPTDTSKPSGLVATVPLGGGKPKVGSSTRIGGDTTPVLKTWEVIVRLDDGRFSMFTLDDSGGLNKGDKVRVKDGKPVLRGD